MSHTKQTPILEYTTADLPAGAPAGTVVFNITESCFNYYSGTEWVSSLDWESTYTTVSANSALWDDQADLTLLQNTSGTWVSNYSTTSANSADWVSSDQLDNIVKLTQAEYDLLTPDPNTLYIITT